MDIKSIYIISNEKVSENSGKYFCDNLDLKSIPEGLSKSFKVNLIVRKSKVQRNHTINNVKISSAKNIFSFAYNVLKTIREKKQSKYFIISISPYTFVACLLLFILNVRPIVYLRSDGFEEYKSIAGIFGVFIYHIMFLITSTISSFISCREHILRKKNGKIVSPSQLTEVWFKNTTKSNLDKARLLYVGRIRVEKGIFSFLKLFKNLKKDISLSIVTTKIDQSKIDNLENISCIDTQSEESLIKTYDKNNIFILPSFTEGHPQVLDEALARLRPVIVFDEIEHVKRDREGVFICKRNIQELNSIIEHILKNYSQIQSKIKTNNLPNRESFIGELKSIINEKKI